MKVEIGDATLYLGDCAEILQTLDKVDAVITDPPYGITLPPTSCWLVWDKLNGDNDFADCELCWTNWHKAVRRLQWRWNGMIRQGNEERYHPTQKPIGVMKWVIELCPKSETILDPFMGSGTTGVAAIQMGRKFIGIEREPKYFDIACKRIEQASRQVDMFVEQPKQEQTSLI